LMHFRFTDKSWFDIQASGLDEVYVIVDGIETCNKQQLYGNELLDSNVIARIDRDIGAVVCNGGNKHFISTRSKSVYNLQIRCTDREGRDISIYLNKPRFDAQIRIY